MLTITHAIKTPDSASEVSNTPAGNIAATDVQAAINELDTEKQPASANLDEYATVNPTTQGLALLDDATAADQRTTLGLGTAAVKNTGTSGDAVPLLNAGATWDVGADGLVLTNTNDFPTLFLRRLGTIAASNGVGVTQYQGPNSVGANETYTQINGLAETITDGAEDGQLRFVTIRAGTSANRMRIGGGVYHPSATGTDKGDNTINFGAVYDDNTLLTCYPFDAYLDGSISFEKWDAKVPDRIIPAVLDDEGNEIEPARTELRHHDDMRKFAARLGTKYDPLDIDKYEAHWREKRHLSSLPNEATFDPVKGLPTGAWIQRLVETVELQAIHISQLNDRLKVLEAQQISVDQKVK